MEIKIEVSDEKFSEFFGDNMEQYITEDIKKEIVKNAIADFCASEEFRNKIKNIFIERGDWSNNYCTKLTKFGELILIEAIRDDKELLGPAKQTLENTFNEYSEGILVKALSKMIISSLFNTTDFQVRAQEAAEFAANSICQGIMSDHVNSKHGGQY